MLTSIQHAKDANDLFHVDYGWDAANRRTFTRDLVDSTNSELYTHDARDRLTEFERGTLNQPGTSITTPTPSTYLIQSREWVSLDRRGNWLDSQTTVNSVQTGDTRQRNAVNEYTSWLIGGGPAITPGNDANGNLTYDGSNNYIFDEEDLLISVTEVGESTPALILQYDALGNRVISTIDGTETTWHIYADAPHPIEEREDDNTLLREFVYGRDFLEPVVLIDRTAAGADPAGTDEPLYYLQDMLHSVVALTDDVGVVVEEYQYEPYGQTYIIDPATSLRIPNSAFGNPLMWTGQRYDAAVGLYHFRHRAYLPSLGRWLQRDPIGYAGGSVSLYEYVGSSAIGSFDPLGLDPENSSTPGGGGGGGGGGGNGSPGSPPGSPPGDNNGNPNPDPDPNNGATGGKSGGKKGGEKQSTEEKAQEFQNAIEALQEKINNETNPNEQRKLEEQKQFLVILLRRLMGDYRPGDDSWLEAHGQLEHAHAALAAIHNASTVVIIVGEGVVAAGGIVIGAFTPIPGDEFALVFGAVVKTRKALKGLRAARKARKAQKRIKRARNFKSDEKVVNERLRNRADRRNRRGRARAGQAPTKRRGQSGKKGKRSGGSDRGGVDPEEAHRRIKEGTGGGQRPPG